MAMIAVNEHFLISELKCLIQTVRSPYCTLQDNAAVETILWHAAQEIAATKSGQAVGREQFEHGYALTRKHSKEYCERLRKKAGAARNE